MKTLVLDQGNSTLFAGVFRDDRLMRSARINVGRDRRIPRPKSSPEKTGSGLSSVGPAREGNPAFQLQKLTRGKVDRVALCSVVPKQTRRLVSLVKQTFGCESLVLSAKSDHGLKVGYHRPAELGVDRLANALGAQKLYPRKHVIVVDCGTATTLTLLHRDGTLLGGAILPGLAMWPAMLNQRTASLPEVALRASDRAVGRDTESAIRSGIMLGHTGAIRELICKSRVEAFGRSPVVVLGTGGQVTHFKEQSLFTHLERELILHGLQAFASENTAHA